MKGIFKASLAVFLFSIHSNEVIAQSKPNIVFILADDLGIGDIEPYGQKEIKTPNLQRMAKEGKVFTNHYSGNSVCAPSRCVLMTGKHTGHAIVRGNLQDKIKGQFPLPEDELTVAQVLKNQGYTTGIFGKWGLGETNTTGDPLKKGFDVHFGYTDQVLAHNHFPEFLLRNGKKEFLNNKVIYGDTNSWHKGLGSYSIIKNQYADELFANEAINFIDLNKNKPFFVYLAFVLPHDNGEYDKIENCYEVPSQGIYKYKKEWTKQEKDYAASVTLLDKYTGKVLDYLKKSGLDKNTLVIFTSDNGTQQIDLRFKSNGKFRGMKRDILEGGIRAPFIAWMPSKIKANSVSNLPSTFYDFLATAAEVSDSKTKNIPTDGISYWNELLGKSQQKHPYLYFEIPEKKGGWAVVKGKWKALQTDVCTELPKDVELYNIEIDPSESKNLASENPEIVKEMIDIMKKERQKSPLFPMNAID